MLLTSPDITVKPVLSFSNGNCELLIEELPQLHMTILVVYNPPKPNFSLRKFEEIIKKIDNHMKVKDDTDFILMGDLNFPPRVTAWYTSESGVFPNQKEGVTDEKLAFQLLIDLSNKYGLTQLIDKPTRGNNILYLLYTNNPSIFSICTSKSLKPITDHNMINFKVLSHNPNYDTEDQNNSNLSEIAKYNFKKANKDNIKEALTSINWDDVL